MRISTALSALSLVSLAAAGAFAQSQDGPPPWAYPVNPPNFQRAPAFLPKVGIPTAVNEWLINTGEKLILVDTGASNGFAAVNVNDRILEHHRSVGCKQAGDMIRVHVREIVATGRKPDVFACSKGARGR